MRPAQCAHWKGSATNRALPRSNTPAPGILFFDAWRVEPTLDILSNLPSAQDAPEEDTMASSPTSPKIDQAKAREEEADTLARAVKNQAEDGPNTRRTAIRAYKYLKLELVIVQNVVISSARVLICHRQGDEPS